MAKLRSEQGQMSIFVALIFQILFVFFAMAINIGLLVHDKINLQNSVDLAAYYGAQKMAETMNAMAHINYQIRQDFKLLAFRTRVIGGMGYDEHPWRTGGGEGQFNGNSANLAPSCIAWLGWIETVDKSQNICRDVNHEIRTLPRLPVVAGFIPINVVVSRFVDQVRALIVATCEGQRDLNWNYTASSFHMYRIMMAKRKAAFKALAVNISKSPDAMLDMDANSIQEGVKRTLENNLTEANFQGGLNIEYYNGLQDEALAGLPNWLSEILIAPQMFYIFFEPQGGGGCQNRVRVIRDSAGVNSDPNLITSVSGEPNTPELHSSLGFEKNPWRMAYYGVKATTSPRKPFAPFGEPVQLVARAFAKPFGGRMGPWNKARWARGSEMSGDGPSELDPLVPPRISAPGALTNISVGQAGQYVPNFSRFPGDKFGLKSRLALRLNTGYNSPGFPNAFGLARDYGHIAQLQNPEGDPMSYNPGQANDGTFPGGVARTMELAGVAPDLFDITYYSIEANFNNNFGNRRIWSQLNVQFPRDLGSTINQNETLETFTQVEHTNANSRRSSGGLHFYKITDPKHMLTGWHQKAESDFELDKERFGKCGFEIPLRSNVPAYPSQCLVGGRSGYSVKLVSKNYLKFGKQAIGGEGESEGAILNPPPDDF